MSATPQSPSDGNDPAGLRVDIWLWAARFFKTRSLAKQAIEAGKVDVNDTRVKPSRPLRIGDRMRIVRGDVRMDVVVLRLDARRGPASAAALMYDETDASRSAREALREQRRLEGFVSGGRPDKQQRRNLRELKERGGPAI